MTKAAEAAILRIRPGYRGVAWPARDVAKEEQHCFEGSLLLPLPSQPGSSSRLVLWRRNAHAFATTGQRLASSYTEHSATNACPARVNFRWKSGQFGGTATLRERRNEEMAVHR